MQFGKEFESKFNQNAKAEKARQKLLRQEEGNTKQQLLEGMSRFLRQTQQACMKGASLEQLSSMVNQQYQNLQNVYCRNGVVSPNFSKKLTLRTKLVPVPFKNTDTQVQFSCHDIPDKDEIITSEAVPFYAPETQITYSKDNRDFSPYWHRAVELYFQDFGVLENQSSQEEQIAKNFQLCLPQDKLVYKMEFPIQTKPLIFQNYTTKNNQWETVDHRGRCTKNSIPLLAYGGFYHPNHSLAEIQNYFTAVISSDKEGGSYIIPQDEKPYLRFYKSMKMREIYNMTLEGGKNSLGWFLYFADSLPSTALLSLSEHLKQGLAEVILEDQTTKEKYCYISEDYKHDPKGPDRTAVDITFVPKMIKIEDELPSDYASTLSLFAFKHLTLLWKIHRSLHILLMDNLANQSLFMIFLLYMVVLKI